MDHADVIARMSAENYLLGQLTPAEGEEFEEHYFTCPECIEDLKSGLALTQKLRAHFRAEPGLVSVPAPRPAVWRWLRPAVAWAAAAVMLLAILVFQSLVTVPRLRSRAAFSGHAQALPAFSLVTLGARAAAPMVVRADPAAPLAFFVDVPPQDGFVSYTCRLQTEAGAPRFSVDVPAGQSRDPALLFVPAGTLAPGRFVLIMEGHKAGAPGMGTQGELVARYEFAFEPGSGGK
jgi:anti-sigma factor RsiW